MDNDTPKATERSEGGRKTPDPRPVQYPKQLVLRLDAETMAALAQDAKENNRTIAQTARGWLWKARDAKRDVVIDLTYRRLAPRELERESFEAGA